MLVNELDSGGVKVIDLTQPLSSQTPVIGLPPPFASSPGFSREVISRYDDKGPDWYWNTLHFGEHTGTHFDAPNHWITGRDLPDNAVLSRRFKALAQELSSQADFRRCGAQFSTRQRSGLPNSPPLCSLASAG